VTQTTVSYIAVGVNLQIQPRITEDGYVTSHVFAEVSSVAAFVATQQGQVPQISLRQATTQATVKDGESFIIGGLLQQEEITNMSKIPFLGSLPIIGGLFRVRHDSSTRTNLYIFITPHIIHQVGLPNAGTIPGMLPKPAVPGPTPGH
jgi:general secretion pathway protein D